MEEGHRTDPKPGANVERLLQPRRKLLSVGAAPRGLTRSRAARLGCSDSWDRARCRPQAGHRCSGLPTLSEGSRAKAPTASTELTRGSRAARSTGRLLS